MAQGLTGSARASPGPKPWLCLNPGCAAVPRTRRTNYAGSADPATWGNFSPVVSAQVAALMAQLAANAQPGTSKQTRPVQQLSAGQMVGYLNTSLGLYLNNSLPYMGGMAARGLNLPRRP